MMKKIFSLMLLCAAVVFASCGNDDDDNNGTSTSVGVSGVTLDKTTLSIMMGTTGTLIATVAPENVADKSVTWSSDKTDIATVANGVVTAVKAGTANITATSVADKTKYATCAVTVGATYVEVDGLKVAVGNLVADGANNAKIGAPTDGGLFFQLGSLVGWSKTDPLAIVVSPVGCTVTSWSDDWVGDPTTENAVTGTGDPCKYYLKDTWRLPTKDEYAALFADDDYSDGTWKWENSSIIHSTKNLTFPASGYRCFPNGILTNVEKFGYYWSSTASSEDNGYALRLNSSYANSSYTDRQSSAMFVRCVKD